MPAASGRDHQAQLPQGGQSSLRQELQLLPASGEQPWLQQPHPEDGELSAGLGHDEPGQDAQRPEEGK